MSEHGAGDWSHEVFVYSGSLQLPLSTGEASQFMHVETCSIFCCAVLCCMPWPTIPMSLSSECAVVILHTFVL